MCCRKHSGGNCLLVLVFAAPPPRPPALPAAWAPEAVACPSHRDLGRVSLSFSAISENGRLGGDWFLVGRTLGPGGVAQPS